MSATSTPVRAKAPGKINVFMRVGARLADGYHDVATAYQAVSLCEEVSARHADDFSVAFTGPIDASGLAVDDSNIAIKAARLLAAHVGYGGGVRLDVLKRVPIAGGMGGGSADAAATLVACDALWGTQLPKEELHRLAAVLGADVPFALMGGTAVGTGRGDRLSPALASGTVHWVLATVPFGLSTPAVYAELDAHRERHRDEFHPTEQPVLDPDVLQALRTGDPHQLAEALDNDLQVAALHLRPELAGLLELGERAGALAGIVSGSGPTVAFLAAGLEQALSLQVTLSAARVDALRVFGPVAGARLITD